MFSSFLSVNPARQDVSAHPERSGSVAGLWRAWTNSYNRPAPPVVLGEQQFKRGLRLEPLRAERSGKPFLVFRIEGSALAAGTSHNRVPKRFVRALTLATRQTDSVGWFEAGKVLGVICPELGDSNEQAAADAILKKYNSIVQGLIINAPARPRITVEMHLAAPPSVRSRSLAISI